MNAHTIIYIILFIIHCCYIIYSFLFLILYSRRIWCGLAESASVNANVEIFHRIFFNLLQIMDADWQDYTSSRYGSRIMKSTADLAHRASRWIVGLQIGSVTFYSLGVLAANVNDPARIEPYTRELILKMALPFNISTEVIYITVQSVQFYHLFLVGLGITIVNSLLVTLVSPNCAIFNSIFRVSDKINFISLVAIFLVHIK